MRSPMGRIKMKTRLVNRSSYLSYLACAWAGGVLLLLVLLRETNDDCGQEVGEWVRLLRIFSRHDRRDPYTLFTQSYIERYIKSHGNLTISYDPFAFPKPQFIDPNDEVLFQKNPDNMADLQLPPASKLTGRIEVVRNATIHESYDCGWQMNNSIFSSNPHRRIRKRYSMVSPLLVPQSNSFQHFIDGVIPKLIQAQRILELPNITLLMYRPWDRIIEDFLEELHFPRSRIAYYDGGYIAADYLISTCITPPVHPGLWKEARHKLGSSSALSVPMEESFIVLLTRAKSRNAGRQMVNFDEISDLLRARYGENLVLFKGGYSFSESRRIFSQTRILIGVHGGAFYNLVFCPRDTHIVEIIPTAPDGAVVPEMPAHNIVWKMAAMLDQTYWRLSEPPINDRGNVYINREKLLKVLDRVDRIQQM